MNARTTLFNRVGVFAMATLCGLLAAGCGVDGAESVPFTGTVTLKGAPLPNADVTLIQGRATDPGPFTGTTDSEGRFSLGPVGDEGSGVAPGTYRLTITTVKPVPGADEFTPPPAQKEIVPQEYADGSIRVEVPEGGVTDRKFEL
jgi:hypothetical protein